MQRELALAVLAGAAGCGCGVALLATSGFLLARASQHPNIVAISVAIVMVRALSVSRGLLRYLERLFSHDVAFRVLADVRVRIYRKLERLAPAGLAAFRSGDVLTRLISDVDATQDLFIRGIAPPLAAVLVGAGATTAVLLILAPAAGVLAAGLLAAGVLVPLVTAASARRAARLAAPVRGGLGATLTDLLGGAAELHAFGAVEAALARTRAADAELTRLARRSASASGLGTGLSAAASGLTLWGVLLLGAAVTGSGSLGRVPLAVITLTARPPSRRSAPCPRPRCSSERPGPRPTGSRAFWTRRTRSANRATRSRRRTGSCTSASGVARSGTRRTHHRPFGISILTSSRAGASPWLAPPARGSPPSPRSCSGSST